MAKDNVEYIRGYPSQLIIGIIETKSNGDQVARDFPSQQILGYYKKQYDWTTDFYGNRVSLGNSVVQFIYKKHPDGR